MRRERDRVGPSAARVISPPLPEPGPLRRGRAGRRAAPGTFLLMDQPSPRGPHYYRRGFWERMGEGLRYGGGVGQWSWLIHRLTGLGVLLFLVIHIVDTFL